METTFIDSSKVKIIADYVLDILFRIHHDKYIYCNSCYNISFTATKFLLLCILDIILDEVQIYFCLLWDCKTFHCVSANKDCINPIKFASKLLKSKHQVTNRASLPHFNKRFWLCVMNNFSKRKQWKDNDSYDLFIKTNIKIGITPSRFVQLVSLFNFSALI